jgi:hypothetical protein
MSAIGSTKVGFEGVLDLDNIQAVATELERFLTGRLFTLIIWHTDGSSHERPYLQFSRYGQSIRTTGPHPSISVPYASLSISAENDVIERVFQTNWTHNPDHERNTKVVYRFADEEFSFIVNPANEPDDPTKAMIFSYRLMRAPRTDQPAPENSPYLRGNNVEAIGARIARLLANTDFTVAQYGTNGPYNGVHTDVRLSVGQPAVLVSRGELDVRLYVTTAATGLDWTGISPIDASVPWDTMEGSPLTLAPRISFNQEHRTGRAQIDIEDRRPRPRRSHLDPQFLNYTVMSDI